MAAARGRPRAASRTLAHGVAVEAYKQRPFARSLVLVEHLAEQLGARYGDLLRRLSDSAGDGGSFVEALRSLPGRRLPDASLLAFDASIRRHEAHLARHRGEFRLTYFQWLAALLVEMVLDALKAGEGPLLRALEDKRQHHAPFLSRYTAEDLRKLACFMATGSGKTLLLHINLLQFLEHGLFTPDNILLLTPNEALSAQHRDELTRSGLDGLGVRILEITKLYVDGAGHRRPKKGVSEPVSRYEGPNLLLVDEGHKGGGSASDTKGEKEWRAIRETLAHGNTAANRGFVFEYSATFAQMAAGNPELYDEYAKCVVADFGYARFHGDGYGKDFRILNARARDSADLTLAAGLLSFYRQVRAAAEHPTLLAEYRLASPLWVALGKSVTAKNSDVGELLAFLDRAAHDAGWLAKQFDRVRRDVVLTQSGLGGDPLDFGALRDLDGKDLAADAQRRLFGGTGRLRAHLVSESEIGLRSTAATDDRYCAVVRVGEARKLVKQLQEAGTLDVGDDDRLAGSLFARIESDEHLRFLIGARMFVEGWSSWRVAAMALMNVGRSAGSEIVQMFGRGVRLRGKGMSLRRAGSPAPEAVRLLETLHVFGVRADYLQTFLETLQREGVAREVHFWPLREHSPPVDKLDLLTLEGDEATFDGVVLPDPARDGARIVLDGGLSVTVGMSTAAAVGTASRTDYAIGDWLDPALIYEACLQWRARNPTTQLVATPGLVQTLAKASIVQAPAGELDGPDPATHRRKQALAADSVMQALDNALNRAQREFYAERVRAAPLRVEDSGNFPRLDANHPDKLAVRIEAETREDIVAALREHLERYLRGGLVDSAGYAEVMTAIDRAVGVGNVSAQVLALIGKLDSLPRVDDGTPPLPRFHFDRHLYSPLFVEERFETRNGQLALFGPSDSGVRMTPPALNAGEARFVYDLRAFWESECRQPEWACCELFLLRNQARTGVGLFVGAGFYPDFLLWLKRGASQVLCFVEPKGLGRAWPKEKIESLSNLPKQSPSGLPLRGFTVTSTSLDDIRALQPQADELWLAGCNVLLQSSPNYVKQMLTAVRDALE